MDKICIGCQAAPISNLQEVLTILCVCTDNLKDGNIHIELIAPSFASNMCSVLSRGYLSRCME